MIVRSLQRQDENRWDEFVDSMESGTVFHKIVWKKIIDTTFQYKSVYLLAEENNRIRGVLPLYHLRSLFVGNALLSTPFAVYGGILADSIEVEKALFNACKEYANSTKASYVELRHRYVSDMPHLQIRDTIYSTFQKPLAATAEENLKNLPKESRRMVRVGIKKGLVGEFNRQKINEFYNVFATSLRHLGTPVFPKRLFNNCINEFKDKLDLLIVYHNEKPVAGVMSFYYRDTVLPYYGGSLPEARNLSPNNFMYWKLMSRAGEKGYTYFDFGRSKQETGTFNFKRHMGFEPISLPYQYYLTNGTSLPNNNPTNPKFRQAISLWRHMPLPLTKVLGPKLIKYFP